MLFIAALPASYPGAAWPIHVDLSAPLTAYLGFSGLGAGDGVATAALPLPPVPALSGMSVYVQSAVLDPAGPLSLVLSDAVQINID